jgi:hypothetical protein
VLALAGGAISRKNAEPLEVQKAPKRGMGHALRFRSDGGDMRCRTITGLAKSCSRTGVRREPC